MDFKSNILLIPTYGITDQCIGRAAPAAAPANSCIDFQSALDQSFSLHDTSARPLLHNYKEEVYKEIQKKSLQCESSGIETPSVFSKE